MILRQEPKIEIIVLFLAIIMLFTGSCTSEQLNSTSKPVETTGDVSDTPCPAEATDFVENVDENQDCFAPGIIMLRLKKPIDASLEEVFPDLNIKEYQDTDERAYNRFKDIPGLEEQAEEYRSRIGTGFMIVLTEKTSEAVLRGIKILSENANVEYAQPDYIEYPADPSNVPELTPSSTSHQATVAPYESPVPETESPEEKIKLVIRGKNIADGHYVNLNYEYRYAELPFIAIMEELGAKTNWLNEKSVSIVIHDKTYILNTEKCTLTEVNSEFNLFQISPGATHGVFSKIVDNEFIVDEDSLKGFLINVLGFKMNVDFDQKIIIIS